MGRRWGVHQARAMAMDRRPRPDHYPSCPACGKTSYSSSSQARQANQAARFRFRVYFCRDGRAWHVMNMDKR